MDEHAMGTIPTRADVEALRPELAAAAQAAYDGWEQDEDGEDAELGRGGICDQVAERMQAVLEARLPGIRTSVEYVEMTTHVEVIALVADGTLRVDVPASAYEVGAGYVWRKRPGVALTAQDVTVDLLSADPADYALYAFC